MQELWVPAILISLPTPIPTFLSQSEVSNKLEKMHFILCLKSTIQQHEEYSPIWNERPYASIAHLFPSPLSPCTFTLHLLLISHSALLSHIFLLFPFFPPSPPPSTHSSPFSFIFHLSFLIWNPFVSILLSHHLLRCANHPSSHVATYRFAHPYLTF